jgi:ketosteroid isomerase-like protein
MAQSMLNLEEIQTQIRDLEQRRYAAMTGGDVDAFAALAHPELIYTHSNGVVDSLSSYIAKCRDGYYQYLALEHPIDRIMVFENIALVYGSMSGEIISGGTHKALNNRALSVWVRLSAEWRLLSYQPTPIK